ncbi:hypothetical protein CARUB_v10015523mg [Capsella rubella]|uniref:F-box domain-containing protein n=1 Tax=Capsella rubella TaxID=81985 RepID=R0G9C9_9BRAS|nr:hypothetical protein CARUB_v10015523mg [Capsella rubella]
MWTTTISHLPEELLNVILSRTGFKSRRSVRLTCKKWNNLFKNQSFIGEDATTREGESKMILLRDNTLYLMSIVMENGGGDALTEQKGKLICQNNDQIKISQVFHCEGLLLCVLKDENFSLVVWNPYWGQTRWIEPRHSFKTGDGTDMYRYALGYNNKKRCHKILRFIDNEFHIFSGPLFVMWYEMYDFESDLWTTLDVTPQWTINLADRGVSLKGNTYWCAHKWKSFDIDYIHIICFDFTKERFGPLMRLPFGAKDDSLVALSCVRDEKLAALFCYDYVVEFWFTTKIEAKKMLWTRFLTLNIDNLGTLIPGRLLHGAFFIDEAKRVAMILDKTWNGEDTFHIMGDAGYGKEVSLGEPEDKLFYHPLVCSYAPSLVQIELSPGFQRKQQSDLEKRRCDENISRFVSHEEELTKRLLYAEAIEKGIREGGIGL